MEKNKRIVIYGTGKTILFTTNLDDPYFFTKATLKSNNTPVDAHYSCGSAQDETNMAKTILEWIEEA